MPLMFPPYIVSLLTGFFLVKMILREPIRQNMLFYLSLSAGLGLGISAYAGYLNFMFLNKFNPAFQISFNLFFCGLSFYGMMLANGKNAASFLPVKTPLIRDGTYFLILATLFVPLGYLASFYPYGGWDAWAVWHFKAKFMFLAGENWREMFDPQLWRSSPHYPLLLPLVNVWSWVLQKEPLYYGPMFTSLLFTFITFSLLVSSLSFFNKDKTALLASCLLLTSSFFAKTSISQYADVVLGYYLLAGLACLVISQKKDKEGFALLGGIFVGFLSFTKPEGLIAALLVSLLAVIYLYFLQNKKLINAFSKSYCIGAAMSLVPSLIYYAFIAPENMTSINGFLSSTDPSTWLRLKIVLVFFVLEAVSLKWNGTWILLIILLLLNMKRIFSKWTWIIPAFLAGYFMAIITYYWMNTYFEILWWLSVTLGRIFASLLPVMIWWVIYSTKDKSASRV